MRLSSHSYQALPQLSCRKAGKSLTMLKKEIEMFMTGIVMFVAAEDWI